MNLPKKILFSLFSLFLVYRSYILLGSLNRMPEQPGNLIGIFFIAFLLNLYITGVFAFPGFVFPTHKLLGASYFQVRNPKSLKNLYDKLGVEGFRKLLIKFIWGTEKNRKKYFDGTRTGFDNFIYQSKQSEVGHVLPFVILSVISIWLFSKAWFLMGIMVLIINIIGNLYPVILQRFHRIRIEKVMNRYLRKQVAST